MLKRGQSHSAARIEINKNIMDDSVFIVRARCYQHFLCSLLLFCLFVSTPRQCICHWDSSHTVRMSRTSASCIFLLPFFSPFRLLIFIYIYNGVDVVLVGVCSFVFRNRKISFIRSTLPTTRQKGKKWKTKRNKEQKEDMPATIRQKKKQNTKRSKRKIKRVQRGVAVESVCVCVRASRS